MPYLKGFILSLLIFVCTTQWISAQTTTVSIATDKAAYKPGDKVVFIIDKTLPPNTKVRYKLLGNTIESMPVKGTKWEWVAPTADFTGYMAELYGGSNDHEKIYATIAVDVSSNPARFPRNGFLSNYGRLSDAYMDSVMQSLNRYHMNYVQFQDWEYEHHKPLAGTIANPDDEWKDIGGRTNYKSTVQNYIALAHAYGMLTLHYNLIYGSLDNANTEGVSDEWRLFTDAHHKNEERIPLPMPPFKSGLNIMNPANINWQQYIATTTAESWKVYDFDGYQIDQMGDLNKPLFDYNGKPVDMALTFEPFIKAMKIAFPQKTMVMNAVAQYGQLGIAASPVDFLYTEVWPPDDGFKDLVKVILHNDSLTNGQKRTVMPAYMDYDLAEKPGYFSTPGVILADAVIFAFGGSHLELGDHMLGKEYFPNAHLKMHNDLKAAMVNYYDFLTGYENLLRDGGLFNTPTISSADHKVMLNNWPPQQGQVSIVGKDMGTKQVLHFINFTNANSLHWRDNKGIQAKPITIIKPAFNFTSAKTVKKIWLASPDINGGASTNIAYKKTGNTITLTLPSLQYWDMVVIEYK
ncbi:MAG: glycoside hydrolase family 66 protein [Sphingobacteriales bacterium]